MRRSPKPAPQPQPPQLGEVLDFMRLMWAVDHGLQVTSKRMHATIGLTGPQRLVIRVVGRYPGIAAGRLAEILHLDPSTLTFVLGRLVDRGLVRRAADPGDRRRVLLTLTARGRRTDQPAAGTVEDAVGQVLSGLPRARLEAARSVLTALAAALEAPSAAAERG
jgi:DNA-binding MarR family transcriptional regulator